jgi:UDP-4-amino-4,6-dideoxy-N-acetyl-beta-L-altrosamine transaminase
VTVKEKTQRKFLPYGRQQVTQEDLDAVCDVLRSDWLTQGPTIPLFEQKLSTTLTSKPAVACSSGTAALHLAMMALDLGPGDVVVTTPITFLADANCARYVGAEVRFADIDPETACMSPRALEQVLAQDVDHRVKVVIPVHFGGQPADLPSIHSLAEAHGAVVVDDACHAPGAWYEDGQTRYGMGASPHSVMTVLSFHPVKHVAMGEGGAVLCDHPDLLNRLRALRNHGITTRDPALDHMALDENGDLNPWYYEMPRLGYNYRVSDIQAALGISQLERLEESVNRRNQLAKYYRWQLEVRFPDRTVRPLALRPGVRHAYHLFVVRIDFQKHGVSRSTVMRRLREAGIGTQVHYIPIHLQPYYRQVSRTGPGDYPAAEGYYQQALTLPLYPQLEESDVDRVLDELSAALIR